MKTFLVVFLVGLFVAAALAEEKRSQTEEIPVPAGCAVLFDSCVVCGEALTCGTGHVGDLSDPTAFQLGLGCSGPCLLGMKLPLRLLRIIESIELQAPRYVTIRVLVPVAVSEKELERLKLQVPDKRAPGK